MAARRRPGFDPKAGFKGPAQDSNTVHAALLKSARQSGQLNLSGRNLTEVPVAVWRINLDVPEEAKEISLTNTEDRWWEQVDLTKLILASNILTKLSEDIQELPALTTLDLHDNRLDSLPVNLEKLSQLVKLNLSHNSLTALPQCVCKLSHLQFLHLSHNQLTGLPDNIGDLSSLEELDVSHNGISCIPASLGFASRIMRLNLANNKITQLPPDIGAIKSLRTLDLDHNALTALPEELGQLRQLESLYLRHNRLRDLPSLPHADRLSELLVGNNQMSTLSVSLLAGAPSLSILDLRDNKLTVIPEEISTLMKLERLDLTNNDLSTLPLVLGTMTALKSVVLDGNPMKGIRRDIVMRGTTELKKYLRSRMDEPSSGPASAVASGPITSGVIGAAGDVVDPHQVKSSKALDFSGKKASDIPDDIWAVLEGSDVAVVNFSKNLLSTWPQRISCVCGSLTELNLGINRLTSVPPEVGQLHKLRMLDLRNNQLSGLPAELKSLLFLRELIISCNRFKEVPAVVHSLSRLEILLACDNQIESIDAEGFKRMPQLATLDLQNNDIASVPPELGNCEQLRSLQIAGNRFKQPRAAILAKGTVTLLEYLRGRIAV